MTGWTARLDNPVSARLRDPAATGYSGIGLGVFAAFLGDPADRGARGSTWSILIGIVAVMLGIWTVTRGRVRLGWRRRRRRAARHRARRPRDALEHREPERVFNASLVAQTFAFSTPLVFGAIAGMFSERSGVVNIGLEGMMLMGAFWGVWGADKGGSWVVGLIVGMPRPAARSRSSTRTSRSICAPTRSSAARRSTSSRSGSPGYFFFQLYHGNYVSQGVSTIPNVQHPGHLRHEASSGRRSATSTS